MEWIIQQLHVSVMFSDFWYESCGMWTDGWIRVNLSFSRNLEGSSWILLILLSTKWMDLPTEGSSLFCTATYWRSRVRLCDPINYCFQVPHSRFWGHTPIARFGAEEAFVPYQQCHSAGILCFITLVRISSGKWKRNPRTRRWKPLTRMTSSSENIDIAEMWSVVCWIEQCRQWLRDMKNAWCFGYFSIRERKKGFWIEAAR